MKTKGSQIGKAYVNLFLGDSRVQRFRGENVIEESVYECLDDVCGEAVLLEVLGEECYLCVKDEPG